MFKTTCIPLSDTYTRTHISMLGCVYICITCMSLSMYAWLCMLLGFALSVLSWMTMGLLKPCSLGSPFGSFQTLLSSDVLYVEEHDSGGSNTPETEEFTEVSTEGNILPIPSQLHAVYLTLHTSGSLTHPRLTPMHWFCHYYSNQNHMPDIGGNMRWLLDLKQTSHLGSFVRKWTKRSWTAGFKKNFGTTIFIFFWCVCGWLCLWIWRCWGCCLY